MGREFIDGCLSCTLPICDDRNAGCAFVVIGRSKPRQERPPKEPDPKRRNYFREYKRKKTAERLKLGIPPPKQRPTDHAARRDYYREYKRRKKAKELETA